MIVKNAVCGCGLKISSVYPPNTEGPGTGHTRISGCESDYQRALISVRNNNKLSLLPRSPLSHPRCG